MKNQFLILLTIIILGDHLVSLSEDYNTLLEEHSRCKWVKPPWTCGSIPQDIHEAPNADPVTGDVFRKDPRAR